MEHPHTVARYGPIWPDWLVTRGGMSHRGLVWPRHEWPRVAKLLIQLHLIAFGCIPIGYAGSGLGFHPHPILLPPREKGSDRLRGKDGCIHGNDAYRQCRGWRGDGAMGSCREVERWAGYALSLGARMLVLL